LRGDAVGIYLPPQAAQAEGLPEGAAIVRAWRLDR
jgi:hypothetical protein